MASPHYDIIFGNASYRPSHDDDPIDHEYWRITNYTDLELVAGMIAIGIGICERLNAEGASFYLTTNADISGFRVARGILEADVGSNITGRIQPGQFGVWMAADRRFRYNLYAFRTNSFFQGVISMANKFKVDFRDFIHLDIFDVDLTIQTLESYVMGETQFVSQLEGDLGPIDGIGSLPWATDYPVDPDDPPEWSDPDSVKYEFGDENIITPLELGDYPESNDL